MVETPTTSAPATAGRPPAGKAPAKRPKPVAWIDPHGCSGEPCQVCIAFCPVDCIRLVTNDPEFAGPTGYCVVEQEKCIGCNLCAMYCPWDDIVMVQPPAPVPAKPAAASPPVIG